MWIRRILLHTNLWPVSLLYSSFGRELRGREYFEMGKTNIKLIWVKTAPCEWHFESYAYHKPIMAFVWGMYRNTEDRSPKVSKGFTVAPVWEWDAEYEQVTTARRREHITTCEEQKHV